MNFSGLSPDEIIPDGREITTNDYPELADVFRRGILDIYDPEMGIDHVYVGDFNIPMLRKAIPNILANEIIGVQPMPGPLSQIFSMKFKYGK